MKLKAISTYKKRTKKVEKVESTRRRRPKKLRLSVKERSLLLHPPTPKTWRCDCEQRWINSGTSKVCGMCHKERTKKPDLLWPEYVSACAKVGIEPGYKWKISDKTLEPIMMKRGDGKWSPAPPIDL